jgi:hypothetical protein
MKIEKKRRGSNRHGLKKFMDLLEAEKSFPSSLAYLTKQHERQHCDSEF